MSGKVEASTGGAKYSWAVLQPTFCPMLLLSSVKLTCAVMGFVVGVFPFTASLEHFIVGSATAVLIVSGRGVEWAKLETEVSTSKGRVLCARNIPTSFPYSRLVGLFNQLSDNQVRTTIYLCRHRTRSRPKNLQRLSPTIQCYIFIIVCMLLLYMY